VRRLLAACLCLLIAASSAQPADPCAEVRGKATDYAGYLLKSLYADPRIDQSRYLAARELLDRYGAELRACETRYKL
jgi:hypothetical protein